MSNGSRGVFLTPIRHDFTREARGHLPSSLLQQQLQEQFNTNPEFAGEAESVQGSLTHLTVTSENHSQFYSGTLLD